MKVIAYYNAHFAQEFEVDNKFQALVGPDDKLEEGLYNQLDTVINDKIQRFIGPDVSYNIDGVWTTEDELLYE